MRKVLSIMAVAALSAAVVASAANLIVDGGTIQAGDDFTLTCDDDGVNVDGWGLETDTALVDRVRIKGISDDCIGNTLFVNLTGATGILTAASIDPLTSAHTGAGQAEVVFPVLFNAADITDIHIFIEGPASTPDTP